MLRIGLEEPDEGVETLLMTLSHFGRMTTHNISLYANTSSYLNSPNTLSVSDASCLFGVVDTYGNGMHIS
jgi:hypothetical protein